MQMECREDHCQLSGRIAPVFLCKVLEFVVMELVFSTRTARFDMIHIYTCILDMSLILDRFGGFCLLGDFLGSWRLC